MDEYEVHGRESKRRRNQAWFAFIGYVPITFAFALLTPKLFHAEKPVLVFVILWMMFFAIAGVRYSIFPCPRCGKSFFSTWLYHFTRRCVHCKLPLYSAKEDVTAQRKP
jgi:hypothetical protein